MTQIRKCFLCGTEAEDDDVNSCESCWPTSDSIFSGQEALDMLNALIQSGIISFEDLEEARHEL